MFRRILAAVLLLVVAGALLIAAWPQLFGLQRTAVIAQLVSFRGAAIVVAIAATILLAILALASRPFRRLGSSLALLALIFALVSVAVLATRGFGNSGFPTPGPSDVTVMSWNTLGGAPGPKAIAKVALDADADIISLPETERKTAGEIATIMKAAGRPMVAHTLAFDEISKARSTSVLVSTDLGSFHIDRTAGSTSVLPSVVLVPDSGPGPTIVAAHPVAPIPSQFAHWKADLNWLSTLCRSKNVIMAGDFNSTLDHLTGLATAAGTTLGRCTDTALATHNAAVGTWPTSIPALLGAPIDHVMVTANWRVMAMRVIQDRDGAGSDHRPIVAQLRPTS